MTRRLLSGCARLDEVLGGGLPANAVNLIVGPPGSGKTIMAQQYLFENATRERPGLYMSTVSEPFDKVLRYGSSLSFFDPDAIGERVFYEDLGAALVADGISGLLIQVVECLRKVRPGLVVIDSFKAIGAFAADEAHFRRFLHELAGRLTAIAADVFWIGEYRQDIATDAPEFGVADAILAMDTERTARRETRALQVMKLRGSGFMSGKHGYRITDSGIAVFPRLADVQDLSAYQPGMTRDSTGIAALDVALGDGYWEGSATLVAGPTGVGKTFMGLHFAFAAVRDGRPAILATFQENTTQLRRIASGFGWSLDDPYISVLSRSPVDMYVDEWAHELLDLIDQVGATRVVVDSLGDLLLASGDEIRFRELLFSLVQRCQRRSISLLFTLEVEELFNATRISDMSVSHLSDNVVILEYFRSGSEVRRSLTVLKTRASKHTPEVREFLIGPTGLTLGDSVSPSRVV